MSKIDAKQPAAEEALTPEQEAAKAEKIKKEEDENLKKKLNDPKFLNFLQKNPDAVNSATDDEYIKEKIVVFEKVQAVKQEVLKFVKAESGDGLGIVMDDSFTESLESIAIKDPQEFLGFSDKVSKYLESASRIDSLGKTYQEVVNSLGGMDVDFNSMSLKDKRDFINNAHGAIDLVRDTTEKEFEEEKSIFKNRKFKTYIPRTQARLDWKVKIKTIEEKISNLKIEGQKLDRDSILTALNEMEGIKSSLKGNQALEIIRLEFTKKAKERIRNAINAKDDNTLTKQGVNLANLDARESLLDDDEFDNLQEEIRKYSKEQVFTGMIDTLDSKETSTLNSFEKGIDVMRKKGLALGLSEEECNEQIISVLRDKIEELDKAQDQGQNRIKLILARRILNNLE